MFVGFYGIDIYICIYIYYVIYIYILCNIYIYIWEIYGIYNIWHVCGL